MTKLRTLARDPRNLAAAAVVVLALELVAVSAAVGGTNSYFSDSHPGSIGGFSLILPTEPPTAAPTESPTTPPTDPPTEVPPECASMSFKYTIVGTTGDDVLVAGNGKSLVFGLGGNDTITGGNGKDCLVGGPGGDTIESNNGPDILLGGPGDDVLLGSNGSELMDGGDGTDVCIPDNGPSRRISCESDTLTAVPQPTPPPPTAEPTAQPTPSAEATPTAARSPTSTAPQADFIGTIQPDRLTVKWQDLSQGDVTHWHWDFGDGATSNQQNPSHTYPGFGDYLVTIAVSGPGGDDSRTKVLHLRAPRTPTPTPLPSPTESPTPTATPSTLPTPPPTPTPAPTEPPSEPEPSASPTPSPQP